MTDTERRYIVARNISLTERRPYRFAKGEGWTDRFDEAQRFTQAEAEAVHAAFILTPEARTDYDSWVQHEEMGG